MKSVFLDYATMGTGDLDLSSLDKVLPGLEVFDNTLPGKRAERIHDAEVVFCNKVRLDADTLRSASALKFIGLTPLSNMCLPRCSTSPTVFTRFISW